MNYNGIIIIESSKHLNINAAYLCSSKIIIEKYIQKKTLLMKRNLTISCSWLLSKCSTATFVAAQAQTTDRSQ